MIVVEIYRVGELEFSSAPTVTNSTSDSRTKAWDRCRLMAHLGHANRQRRCPLRRQYPTLRSAHIGLPLCYPPLRKLKLIRKHELFSPDQAPDWFLQRRFDFTQ